MARLPANFVTSVSTIWLGFDAVISLPQTCTDFDFPLPVSFACQQVGVPQRA